MRFSSVVFSMPFNELIFNLTRSDKGIPWGMRMQGGKDFGSPLTVARVAGGSIADQCGITAGRIILKIGGKSTLDLKHSEALDLVVKSGNQLNLTLKCDEPDSSDTHVSADLLQRTNDMTISKSEFPGNKDCTRTPSTINTVPSLMPTSFAPTPTASIGIGSPSSRSTSLFQAPKSSPSLAARSEREPKTLGYDSVKPSPSMPQPCDGSFDLRTSHTLPSSQKEFHPNVSAKPMGQTQSSVRIPVCHHCQEAIRGPFVTAMDQTWCVEHFVCECCGVKLVNTDYMEIEGKVYCIKDYEKLLAPTCSRCSKPITTEVVSALNLKYHPQCFLCFHCGTSIRQGSFHTENGKIYCDKDWRDLFSTMCSSCNFSIEPGDKFIDALSQYFHSECFNCATCQVNLEGQGFYARNGKPYCKKHST